MKTHKERIRYLISRLYEPGNPKNFDIRMTTSMVYKNLCSIIPANAFDEFDVVEVLEELGFEPEYETKEETSKDAKGKETVREYDDLLYFWYMKKKN